MSRASLRQLVNHVVGVVRHHGRHLVGLCCPVPGIVNRITATVNGTPTHLVQDRQQARQIVVGIAGRDIIGPRILEAWQDPKIDR
jgi:hypothetical protein